MNKKALIFTFILAELINSEKVNCDFSLWSKDNNSLSEKFYGYFKNERNSKLNDTEICLEQINEIHEGIMNHQLWALQFIDSWGKIPSGILFGHLTDIGNFEECVRANGLSQGKLFNGKYCTARIPVEHLIDILPKQLFPTKLFGIRMSDGGAAEALLSNSLSVGVCFPGICDSITLDRYFKKFLKDTLKIVVNDTKKVIGSCTSNNKDIELEPVDIAAISLFSIIGALMLASTIYDIIMENMKRKPNNLFLAFSVLTNGRKLFRVPAEKSENVIGSLNGIRCLSIIWIILVHRYALSSSLPFINLIDGEKWYSSPFSLVLLNASVAVDSFFFLSGFLIAWIGFKELAKSKGELNISMMYVHRFLRLTPVLGAIILFVISLLRYIGTGPHWNGYIGGFRQLCVYNWWQTLFYIQNYVNPNDPCLFHAWYLAVDTQLYILSPIFLILTYKWGSKFLYPTALVLAFASIAYTFATYLEFGFGMTKAQQNKPIEGRRNELIYFPTHTRISPWLIGLCLGYFMFKIKGETLRVSKWTVAGGWLVSLTIIGSILFGTYFKAQPGATATVFEGACYESLSRISWSIALAWIVFACQRGFGGIIETFLSHPFWEVLGRLTYCIYLLHVIVLEVHISMVKTDLHFSDYEMQLLFWGDFCITVLLAIVVVLAFESPIIGLEKILFRRQSKKEKNKSVPQGIHSS